jgi:peroxiredoxin
MTRKAAARSRIALALSFCLWAGGLAAAPPPPKIGDPVPAFTLQTLDGKAVTSESLKGKTVLLDFWATWCPPCRQALPEIRSLSKKNAGHSLVVISVSVDDNKATLEDFVHKNAMDWTQAWDGQGKVTNGIFGISDFPSYVLIDAKGRIAYRQKGWAPISSAALLDQAVNRALECTPTDKLC